MVTGPTPPGTGDKKLAISFTDSKSTSPTTFVRVFDELSPDSEVPASIIIAPFFIISPVIYLPLPMPETITSACFIISFLFFPSVTDMP